MLFSLILELAPMFDLPGKKFSLKLLLQGQMFGCMSASQSKQQEQKPPPLMLQYSWAL